MVKSWLNVETANAMTAGGEKLWCWWAGLQPTWGRIWFLHFSKKFRILQILQIQTKKLNIYSEFPFKYPSQFMDLDLQYIRFLCVITNILAAAIFDFTFKQSV